MAREEGRKRFPGIYCMAKEATPVADPPADPVEVDPSPALDPDPVPFGLDSEMPLDGFPEGMRESLKGKTVKDFSTDHAKMRKGFAQLGEKNKALEAQVAELKGKEPNVDDLTDDQLAELMKERNDKEMVSGPDYREQLNNYFETDEVSEEFLDVLTERGYKPTRRDTLKFLSFLKADREAKIQSIDAAAGGEASGQDLWDWMASDDCTMSKEALIGLNDLAEEGDYTWVGTILKKYREWAEGGGTPGKRAGKGRFSGPTRRGRPAPPGPDSQEISKEGFQTEWMTLTAKQSRGEISKVDEQRAKRELTARRDRTLGVK